MSRTAPLFDPMGTSRLRHKGLQVEGIGRQACERIIPEQGKARASEGSTGDE